MSFPNNYDPALDNNSRSRLVTGSYSGNSSPVAISFQEPRSPPAVHQAISPRGSISSHHSSSRGRPYAPTAAGQYTPSSNLRFQQPSRATSRPVNNGYSNDVRPPPVMPDVEAGMRLRKRRRMGLCCFIILSILVVVVAISIVLPLLLRARNTP